jgi:hypothetical protein
LRAEYPGPTPETLLKATPDFLRTLPVDLQHAAIAIERAYTTLCSRTLAKAQSYEPKVDGSIRGDISDKGEEMLLHYGRWRQEMTRRRLSVHGVVMMLVDGRQPYELDSRYGYGETLLVEALELYNRLRHRN